MNRMAYTVLGAVIVGVVLGLIVADYAEQVDSEEFEQASANTTGPPVDTFTNPVFVALGIATAMAIPAFLFGLHHRNEPN